MRMSEVTFSDTQAQPIDGYGPGFFRVGGNVIEGPALVLPSGATNWNKYGDMERLLGNAGQIDLLFIGTGTMIAPVPANFRKALENAGINSEAMPSRPACRTYNVLLAEGRRVGAALLPI